MRSEEGGDLESVGTAGDETRSEVVRGEHCESTRLR